ncbi:MAG: hypothetical protein F6J93_05245 [Oscillatoria sp. SIO1A7]|nr:hypothetical protein [Oscillatoria sp. SIO1A7]
MSPSPMPNAQCPMPNAQCPMNSGLLLWPGWWRHTIWYIRDVVSRTSHPKNCRHCLELKKVEQHWMSGFPFINDELDFSPPCLGSR